MIRCPLVCRANAHEVSDAGTTLFRCTFRESIGCRLSCASCGQALDLLAVEVGLVVDVDREDLPVLYPLVNGLSLDAEMLAHLLHAHQLPWSLFDEKAGEGDVYLFAQRRAVKLMRKAVSLRGEGITEKLPTDDAYRGAHVSLVGVVVPLGIVENGSQVQAQWALS